MKNKQTLTKKDHKNTAYSILFDKEEKKYKLVTVKFHEQGTAFVESIEDLDTRLAVASVKGHDKFNELVKNAGNDEISLRYVKKEVDNKHELSDNEEDL